jgi:manganese transport protein
VVFGKVGVLFALLGMLLAFGGAAIENCLAAAYNISQFFGWKWGKRNKPASVPFSHSLLDCHFGSRGLGNSYWNRSR